VATYEILGKDYRYKTEFGIAGNTFYIKPGGDPTFGSWRWEGTKENKVIGRFVTAATKAKIVNADGIVIDASGWNSESIPDGWIWQDIGNYYGAGASALNWRENQFDLALSSQNEIGSNVSVASVTPKMYNYEIESQAKAAAKGTGDNAFIYLPVNSNKGLITGTIPAGEKRFVISGAMPAPDKQFVYTLIDSLKGKIKFDDNKVATDFYVVNNSKTVLYTEYSPKLDSIIYWFNKKSINLYGEALIKTMGYQKKGIGATEEGVNVVKDFWKGKGIDITELNIVDGSGLSPQNRITTHAQVSVLQYAKNQSWFSGFYNALPEYNGMKMKSGTIKNVKGFTGYQKSKDGTEYIFSIIVNNYNGSSSSLVQKMYKVLDLLK
jgi:serine-type D-Ala-D-Ala carboxypeptidase/endopeptidase (penicillin-binding protein 4)